MIGIAHCPKALDLMFGLIRMCGIIFRNLNENSSSQSRLRVRRLKGGNQK